MAKKQRRELICEYCGEHAVYYSEKRIMRFCDRICYNKAHADPIIGPTYGIKIDEYADALRYYSLLFVLNQE